MNAQVISSEPKEISLSVTETDIGILYIIQHELLQDSNIDFAGVIVKHPLGEIQKAADSAIKKADEFKQLFNSKIQVN